MSSKRMRYDRIALVERNADEEDESSEEEDSEQDSGSEEANDDIQGGPSQPRAGQQAAKQGKIHVALNKSSELVCHVCGAKGHKAGFVGATYVDCPNKPCYLCKEVGHTTATCPHRAMPGSSAAAAPAAAGQSTSQLLMQREQSGFQRRSSPIVPAQSPTWQVEAAILKLHTRRVCCLEFPGNSDSHVISGDKKGRIAIWNFTQVHDRTSYTTIHRALVNTLRWASWLSGGFDCMSASSDGTTKIFDIETGVSQTLMDINPNGWHRGCKWNMFYGADANSELKILLAGDSDGKVHFLDPRAGSSSGGSSIVSSLQLHKAGSKVNSVAVNPTGGAHVVLTAGADHKVKLFDLRMLSSVKQPTSSSPPAAASAAASPEAAAAADDVAGSSSSRGRGRGRGRRGGRAAAAVDNDWADQDPDPAAAAAAAGGSSRGRGRGRSSRGRGSSSSSSTAAAGTAAGSSTTPTKSSSRSAMAAAIAAAAAAELAVMHHTRVVNHAVFSPSGRKILTTCQDNRLRIWDNLLMCNGPPTKEIVHSHDFNRYLTPFKAEWFMNDPSESKIICGRYISEDFGGIALHPIDIFDATSGQLLQQLTDLNLSTITPVNKPHPRLDIIISGSSSKWRQQVAALLQQLTDLNLSTITPVNKPHPRLDVIISGRSRSLYKWVPQDDEDDDSALKSAASGRLTAAARTLVRQATAAAAAAAVRSSSNFMCVDADPNGGDGSKRGKTKSVTGAGTKSVTKGKSLGTKGVTNTKRGSSAAAAAGRGRKRGRGAAAAAAAVSDDDDDDESDGDDSDDE